MKGGIKAVLESVVWVLIFVAAQIVCSIVFSFAIIFKIAADQPDVMNDAQKLMEVMTQELMANIFAVMIAACILTIAAIVIYYGVKRVDLVEKFRITHVGVGDLLLLIVLGFSLNIVVVLIMGVLPIPEKVMQEYLQHASGLLQNTVTSSIYVCILAPLLEEIIFRGFAFNSLKKALPAAAAIILSAVYFSFMHLNVVQSSYALVLGVFLAFLYYRSQSFIVPVVTHMAFNITGATVPLWLERLPELAHLILIGASVFLAFRLTVYFTRSYAEEGPEGPASGDGM